MDIIDEGPLVVMNTQSDTLYQVAVKQRWEDLGVGRLS